MVRPLTQITLIKTDLSSQGQALKNKAKQLMRVIAGKTQGAITCYANMCYDSRCPCPMCGLQDIDHHTWDRLASCSLA